MAAGEGTLPDKPRVRVAAKSATPTQPGVAEIYNDAFAWQRGWSPLMGWMGTAGAGRVSFDLALDTATLLACADVLSRDLSEITFSLRKVEPNGGMTKIRAAEHPAARMIELGPNSYQSFKAMMRMSAFHVAITMRSELAMVEAAVTGETRALHALRPEQATPMIAADASERYWEITKSSDFDRFRLREVDRRIPDRLMIRVLSRTWDGARAMSNLKAGQRALGILTAMEKHEEQFYDGHAMPRGLVEVDKDTVIQQEQFDRIASDLRSAYQLTGRTGLPFLLERGMTFKPLTQSATDSQMTQSYTNRVADVCRLMRVPPHKIMSFDGVKYDNIEPIERIYVKDSLGPIITDYEDAFSRALLTEDERLDGLCIKASRREAYRDDPKVIMEMATKELNGSAITINEYREATGRETREGLDVFIVPANARWVTPGGEVVVTASGNEAATSDDAEGADESDD